MFADGSVLFRNGSGIEAWTNNNKGGYTRMLKMLPGSAVVAGAVNTIQSTARKVLNPCDYSYLPTVMEVFRTTAGDLCLISPCQFDVSVMEYIIDFNFADPATGLPGRMVLKHPDDESFPPCIELREVEPTLGRLRAKEEGFCLISLQATSEPPEWAGQPRYRESVSAEEGIHAEGQTAGGKRFQRQADAALVNANH